MQKALGVLIASSLLLAQCATTKRLKQPEQYSDKNVIKVYKSKNKLFTGFRIDAFTDDDKPLNIQASSYIDNTYFSNSDKKYYLDLGNILPIVSRVKANKKYELNIFSFGYYPTKKMNFFVKQGDSVVVRSYLKAKEIIIND